MNVKTQIHRIEFIDRLRGLAVVAMFYVHSAGTWLEPNARDELFWIWITRVSGMVAPVFMFLAGVSISLLAHRAEKNHRDESQLRLKIALRGAKIALLGYGLHGVFFMLNGFHGSWSRLLKVDILHNIGISIALFTAIAWPGRVFNWRALALFLAIPVLGQITFRLPIEEWLPVGLAAYITTKSTLALFPLIPYAAWIAFGLFVGPIWAQMMENKEKEKHFWTGLLVAAILMYAAGKGFRWVYYHYGLHLLGGGDVPTRGLIHLFLTKGSMVLLLFAAFRISTKLFDNSSFKPLVLLGQTSLFAYCVHLAIVYHVVGFFVAQSLWFASHALAATILTIVMYGLSVATYRSRLVKWIF
ncbi:MAG: DUF1624 domain-containing protein [Proteobacteria bacterium]|nr:DUF1624 domain-containing protein [Pseudomonadota bacterium]